MSEYVRKRIRAGEGGAVARRRRRSGKKEEREIMQCRAKKCQEMVGAIFGKDRHHFKRGCSLDSQTDDHTAKILGLVD